MKDITGQKFGRLTAIKPEFKDKHYRYHWLCECECGNTKTISYDSLVRGLTKSCGCLNDEQRHKKGFEANRTKHGMCYTRLYRIWKRLHTRCYNSNNPDYQKWYGARGITVCNEWLNSFELFRNWAMENGYEEDLTIDRIDNNGNYEPSNCRWVDLKTQARNKRNNHLITYNGETHCLAEWAEILGVNVRTLIQRVHYGWEDEQVVSKPIKQISNRKT